MKISVVTATYNREKKLPKLYESLCENEKTHSDFEWIIVDDGSTDNTREVVEDWQKSASFPISYFYQENQGKMRAINHGMKYVTGDIVMEVDSDDYLLPAILQTISFDYENLKEKEVYGILYKRKLGKKDTSSLEKLDGKIITLFDMHNHYGYDFDMNLTFKASLRKQYEYPVEDGEKFVTEARLYYQLDQIYEGMLFKNCDIVVGEYLSEGYSKNITKMFRACPKGYFHFFKECLGYCNKDTLFSKRLYFIKHYILFSYLTKKKFGEVIKPIHGCNKCLVILLYLPGIVKSKRQFGPC